MDTLYDYSSACTNYAWTSVRRITMICHYFMRVLYRYQRVCFGVRRLWTRRVPQHGGRVLLRLHRTRLRAQSGQEALHPWVHSIGLSVCPS